MKVGKTPVGSEMYKRRKYAFVQWNDGSKSYYPTKSIAISEMRREQGRR